jgi:2-phosphoglycolate phosphatase
MYCRESRRVGNQFHLCWNIVKFVIFDLDGTLVDSLPLNLAIVNEIRTQKGMPLVSRSVFAPFLSLGAYRIATEFFPDDDEEIIVKKFRVIYGRSLTSVSDLYDGAIPFIKMLRSAGIALAVCSNKPYALCKKVLSDVGLFDEFKVVLGGDSLGVSKPDPLTLQHIASLIGVSVAQGLFVGDSYVDFATASAAGMPYIHHQLGYDDSQQLLPETVQLFNYQQLNESLPFLIFSQTPAWDGKIS